MRFFKAIGDFFKSCWNVIRGLLIIFLALFVLSIVLNAFDIQVGFIHDIATWLCNTGIDFFTWLSKCV